MPQIIYGTAWKKEKTADYVALALEKGFRGIDTACQPKHYNEKLVGEGIVRAINSGLKRENLFLQTKFTSVRGQDPNNIPYDPSAPVKEQVKQSLAVSLKNLKTDFIDSLVMHSPLETWELTWEAWLVFEQFVADGSVRQIGISNCYDFDLFSVLHKEAKVKPAVLQNRFYQDTHYDKELRAFCSKHGVTYQSFWTLTANPHILNNSSVLAIAQKHDKSPAQILYRTLIQENITPLIGTTSPQNMQEDLDVLNFSLTTEECAVVKNCGPF